MNGISTRTATWAAAAMAAVTGLGLAAGNPARAEDKPAPAAPVVGDKVELLSVEGKTYCSHCEFGIEEGKGCGLAVKDKAGKVFVLVGEGDAFAKINKLRFDAVDVKLTGTKVADKKAGEVAYTLLRVRSIEQVK